MRDLPAGWMASARCVCAGARLVRVRLVDTGAEFITVCPHCTHAQPLRDHLEKRK